MAWLNVFQISRNGLGILCVGTFTALVDNRFESDDRDIEDSNNNSLIEMVLSCDGTMIPF